ncbi:MAG: hypothetical protein HFF10_13260 [Angelakisella sp.]|jgi:hypothetical protein|nr:hypothetical protein [Angelakisella sp.]
MEEKDLDFLREQLSRLDEPELPPSLTSAALFARMDEGALTLPEEEAAKAEKKVIPWGRVVRRWAPLAACLVLVLLLYQGREVGLARNFAASQSLTESAAGDSQVPEIIAYSLPEDSAADAGGEMPPLRRAPELAADSAENSGEVQKSAVTAAPPAPEPGFAPPASGLPEAEEGSGSDGGSGDRPNPPTGGEEHPDTGSPPEPSLPPSFDGDSGEEGPSLYKRLKAQMEEIAAQYKPDASLSSRTVSMATDNEGRLVFTAWYSNEDREVQAKARFYCWYYEGKGEAWLEMETYKWLEV